MLFSIFKLGIGRTARLMVRRLVRFYYPRLEVSHWQRIPAEGPVLFVANHANSLIDPVIITIAARRPVHFLAKAPLFDIPVMGTVLYALGMIPAYRATDDPSQVSANLESLARAAQALAEGKPVGIFPEGKSHDSLRLEKIRSGAGRIAVQAAELGAKELAVVPVGINYERKERFRSAIWVNVGKKTMVAEFFRDTTFHDKHRLRALSAEIETQLKASLIHLEEAAWAPLLEDIEAYIQTPLGADPIAALRSRKLIADAMNSFARESPEKARAIGQELLDFHAKVERHGLTMRSDLLQTSGLRYAWRKFLHILGLAIGPFPALCGTLHNALPFAITRAISARVRAPGKMTISLTRLGFGLPIYLGWYVLAGWLLSLYFLPWVAITWSVLMISAGIFALRFWRGARDLAASSWVEARLLARKTALAELRSGFAAARQRLRELAEEYAAREHVPRRRERIAWLVWLKRAWPIYTSVIALIFAVFWLTAAVEQDLLAELEKAGPDLRGAAPATLQALLAADQQALARILPEIDALRQRALAVQQDFYSGKRDFYKQGDDDVIRQLLFSYLNHRSELLRLVWRYQEYNAISDDLLRARALAVGLCAASVLYESGYFLVTQFSDSADAVRKLNEPEPIYQIPGGLYDEIRENIVDARHRKLLGKAFRQFASIELTPAGEAALKPEPYSSFRQRIHQAAHLHQSGTALKRNIFEESLRSGQSLTKSAQYNVQAFFSRFAGETRLRRPRQGQPLISQAQLDSFAAKLRPGDILLERQNWYLSRAFMPGFWAHAALYAGTLEELEKLGLDKDPRVLPHWARLRELGGQSGTKFILEAVPDGVRLTTVEHCLGVADSAAALRPRLDHEKIREALGRAFGHVGKPYDFDFDFFSSDKLVCTELVYRSYDPSLAFPLVKVMGRSTLPPTEIVRFFAEETKKEAPSLECVGFLDGDEFGGQAAERDAVALAASVHRPSVTLMQHPHRR